MISDITKLEKNKLLKELGYGAKSQDDIGLFNGTMGKTICYYVLSRIYSDTGLEKKAKKFLRKIERSIHEMERFDFSEGLSGIGWGIEWLVQNRFLNADTDRILGDLDDVLYELVLYSKNANPSLGNGAVGIAMYFLSRLQENTGQRNRYRLICNLECLVFLSDEISEFLMDRGKGIFYKDSLILDGLRIEYLSQGLILMSELFKRKINTQSVREAIIETVKRIENVIDAITDLIDFERPSIRYLVYTYLLCREKLKNDYTIAFSSKTITFLKKNEFTLQRSLHESISRIIIHNKDNSIENSSVMNSLFFRSLYNINATCGTSYCYQAFLLS